MELNSFIGKVVISTKTKKRFVLYRISAPSIVVQEEKPDEKGLRRWFSFETANGDPFANELLVFEDASLTEPFIKAYSAHCNSEDGRWEEFEYWMRKD